MKIAYLTAGAAGMFCGSCMNDNAVARALIQLGHECLLVPVYTPIRTDDDSISVDRVFLGGVNVYLQQKLAWLARLPRFVDAALNQPALIRWLTRNAGNASPELLGPLTVSMLQGFRGRQRKEFHRLLDWLGADFRPEVVVMTNLLIGGAIPELKRRLGARVFVTLQGDDIFLDSLREPDRLRCETLMQGLVADVDGFLAHSQAYGEAMARRFCIPDSKLHVVPLAIAPEEYRKAAATSPLISPSADSPAEFTVGYLARMAPEKGLHRLVEAAVFELVSPNVSSRVRLRMAGWMGPQHATYWDQQKALLESAVKSTVGQFRWDYAGAVDRPAKLEFLRSLDLFCVPTVYAEPKGRYLLEAVAMGIPYAMPAHGAFPELHERIQSHAGCPQGWLFAPHDPAALGHTLRTAMESQPRRSVPSEELLAEIGMEVHAQRLARILDSSCSL